MNGTLPKRTVEGAAEIFTFIDCHTVRIIPMDRISCTYGCQVPADERFIKFVLSAAR